MREKLIRYLQKKFTSKCLSGVIVFDGSRRQDEESGLSYPNPLVVVYAPRGQSADEYILEMIRSRKHRNLITVVTNDRALKKGALFEKTSVLSNQQFLKRLKKTTQSLLKKEITPGLQEIDELEKIFQERFWRSEEEDL